MSCCSLVFASSQHLSASTVRGLCSQLSPRPFPDPAVAPGRSWHRVQGMCIRMRWTARGHRDLSTFANRATECLNPHIDLDAHSRAVDGSPWDRLRFCDRSQATHAVWPSAVFQTWVVKHWPVRCNQSVSQESLAPSLAQLCPLRKATTELPPQFAVHILWSEFGLKSSLGLVGISPKLEACPAEATQILQ